MASDTTWVARASASAWRSRASDSRNAACRPPSASRICACFLPSAVRIAAARSLQPQGFAHAFDAFGFHLAGHGGHQVRRRADVLDLDTGDLDAPRRRCFIDRAQQFFVDAVTLAEHGIQLHGAQHRADVGLQQVANGMLEVVDLIGRLRRVDHLEETHGIDLYRGVVGR
jgi:hypothetical protein